MSFSFPLVAIGNALVDILSHISEDTLNAHGQKYGTVKGTMTLIDTNQAVDIYQTLDAPQESSGGSAANTMAGYASLGGNGGFIGKVASDTLGETFANDLRDLGLHYATPPLNDNAQTGRCMVLITPDAQRTMNTYLGASTELSPHDVDKDLISGAEVTYLEGYLFDKDTAKKAFITAALAAHAAGKRVALSLSDPFCVHRHREDFLNLVENHIDILFANEEEITALYQVDTFDEAVHAVSDHVEIAALTRGEKGALIKTAENEQIAIEAFPVDQVVDTTGAGDQFAAGFLYGFTHNLPLETAGKLGALAAAEVIAHTGPRPAVNLRTLAIEKGLLTS